MNNTTKLFLLAAMVVQSPLVMAEMKLGDWEIGGGVDLGVQLSSGAERQSARFNQYIDYRNSVLGGLSITASKDAYSLDLSASRIGLRDQSYDLTGNDYGKMKYRLYYDSLFHNFSINTLSMFDPATIGTPDLNLGAGVTAGTAATWLQFPDNGYSLVRKQYGIDAMYEVNEPFYVNLSAEQVKSDGIRPLSTNARMNGRGILEFPEPIDHKTSNASAIVGYRGGDWNTSLKFLYSSFGNANETMTLADDFYHAGQRIKVYLWPDNNYLNLGWQSTLSQLPLDATLATKIGYSSLTNEVPADTASTADMAGTAAGTAPLNADGTAATTFKGKVQYGTANVAWTAHPVKSLDTRAYYNFLRKWNTSTQLTYGAGTSITDPITNGLFQYFKHNAGLDFGYRLPVSTKLSAGYEFLYVDRDRDDATISRDNIYSVQLKNSYFDFLEAKVKYRYLSRSAEFIALNDRSTSTPTGIYFRPFDATDKIENRVSIGFDIAPFRDVDVTLEGAHKDSTYANAAPHVGRERDSSNEVYGDVSYQFLRNFKLKAFYGQERSTVDQGVRAASGAVTTDGHDIEMGYYYGLRLDAPVIEDKWDVTLGWEQAKNNGFYGYDITPGVTTDIESFDDSFRSTFKAKTKYQFTSNLAASIGYMFERYESNDYSFDNYQNTKANSYAFTGAYLDRNYVAHVGYVTGEYRF